MEAFSPSKYLIGITGGIGCGKSSVALMLSRITGFSYIDADKIARDLLAPGSNILCDLRQCIGPDYFYPNKSLDRKLLRQAIFADAKLRFQVDQLIHPLVWKSMVKMADDFNSETRKPVIAEIALLYEAGWEKKINSVVVVYAEQRQCVKRIVQRDMVKTGDAILAIDAQSNLADKVMKADHVVNNCGPWSDTLLQIYRLAQNFSKGVGKILDMSS